MVQSLLVITVMESKASHLVPAYESEFDPPRIPSGKSHTMRDMHRQPTK
jgi:hypothetical protein